MLCTKCEKIMLLVGATFLFSFRIFPRQRKRIKKLFLIMSNSFSNIHGFRITFVWIRKNFFVSSFSILFRVHYFSIIIFIIGTLRSNQCRMTRLLVISKMRICNRYRLCDGIFLLLFLCDNNHILSLSIQLLHFPYIILEIAVLELVFFVCADFSGILYEVIDVHGVWLIAIEYGFKACGFVSA